MITCKLCDEEAYWAAYTCYDVNSSHPTVHPLLARYSAPMFTACDDHLGACLKQDISAPGSSAQWVIKVINRAVA